jgi:hypothetical protein
VLADAEFDSQRNHSSAAPAASCSRRALIETVFSAAKRKLSCRAPGRCLLTQRRQALLLGLTYNLYRLEHVIRTSGCQQSQDIS